MDAIVDNAIAIADLGKVVMSVQNPLENTIVRILADLANSSENHEAIAFSALPLLIRFACSGSAE